MSSLNHKYIVNVDYEQLYYDVLKNAKIPVITEFYGEWCGPSRRLFTYLSNFLEKHKNFILLRVNIDEFSQIAEKEDVSCIPQIFLYFKNERKNDILGFILNEVDQLLSSLETITHLDDIDLIDEN